MFPARIVGKLLSKVGSIKGGLKVQYVRLLASNGKKEYRKKIYPYIYKVYININLMIMAMLYRYISDDKLNQSHWLNSVESQLHPHHFTNIFLSSANSIWKRQP